MRHGRVAGSSDTPGRVRHEDGGSIATSIQAAWSEWLAELLEDCVFDVDSPPPPAARMHGAGVGADADDAQRVPVPGVGEEFLEEGIGRLLFVEEDEDERGFKHGAEESFPLEERIDIIACDPVLEAAGAAVRGWGAAALHLGQEVAALAIKDEIKGLECACACGVDLWEQGLSSLIDGHIGDAAGAQVGFKGGFIMVAALSHGPA